jgi:uncharacterized protein
VRRFDLRSLHFGERSETWREIPVDVDPFTFAGQTYTVEDNVVGLRIDAARVGDRLTVDGSFETVLHGPCERCLEDVRLPLRGEGRDVVNHGESEVDDDDEEETYVRHYILAADHWVRDLVATALPIRLVCRDDCLGLCPVCGVNLNEAGVGHTHSAAGAG